MMFFFVAVLAHVVASGVGCPDLSGAYIITGEDGSTRVVITQTACQQVVIDWYTRAEAGNTRSRRDLRLDGVFRRAPSQVRGLDPQLTAATFDSTGALRVLSQPLADSAKTDVRKREAFVLLSTRDLCYRLDDLGSTWTMVARRVGRSAASA